MQELKQQEKQEKQVESNKGKAEIRKAAMQGSESNCFQTISFSLVCSKQCLLCHIHRSLSSAEAFVNKKWEFAKKIKKNTEKRKRWKKGKGGQTGKAEKAREKGKSEESLCQISVKIWRPPGEWLCTAMPACWAVEQRSLKMAFLNFNNSYNKQ